MQMKLTVMLALTFVMTPCAPTEASTTYQPTALGSHMAGGTFSVTFFGPPPGHFGNPPFTFEAPIQAVGPATGRAIVTPVPALPANTVTLTVAGETWNAVWEIENRIQTIDWVEINLSGSVSVLDIDLPTPGTFRSARGRSYVHAPNPDFAADPMMAVANLIVAPKSVGDLFLVKRITFFPGVFTTAPPLPVTLGFKSDTDIPLEIDCTPPQAWTNLGFDLSGTGGLAPHLCGSGSMTAGSTNQLGLFDALGDTNAFLVAGFSQMNAPFKGGILVPSPDMVLSLQTNGEGTIYLPFVRGVGVPPGVQLYLQYWIDDAGGPFGLSSSNALGITTQ